MIEIPNNTTANDTETQVEKAISAELSLNVGIFNLLPLPVLDGGQVVLLLGEAVAGRKLNEKVKMGLMGACWILLITVMVYATWNDIIRLFG